MSTAVAVWSPSDFANASRSSELATDAVVNLAGYVRSGALDDRLEDAVTWAAQVHALGKLRKDAHTLNVEASRLECIIARRCAQLGRLDVYDKPSYAQAARAMGKADEDEFDEFLASITSDGSVSTLWQYFRGAKARQARIGQIARGQITGAFDRPAALSQEELDAIVEYRELKRPWDIDNEDSVKDAAAELLTNLTGYGEPFTTQEAADKLALILEVDSDDMVTRQGLLVMVREAIGVENRAGEAILLPDGATLMVPTVVTIEESDINDINGWIRIPWQSAGVDQLGLMAAYRRRQAASMLEAARRLTVLHDALAAASTGPDDNNCAELLDRVLNGDYDMQLALADQLEVAS